MGCEIGWTPASCSDWLLHTRVSYVSAPPPRFSDLLRGAALSVCALAALTLSGCDMVSESAAPVVPTADGVTFSDLPDGLSLSGGFGSDGPLVVTVDEAAGPGVGEHARRSFVPASDYGCVLAAADPAADGYRYRSVWLDFPDEARQPDGATLSFRYLGDRPDSESVRWAGVCRIPQTARAVSLMADLLGIALNESAGPQERRASTTSASARVGSGPLDGDIPNGAGATCPLGYDWSDSRKVQCRHPEYGWYAFPEVMVWAPRGGDGGSNNNNDPFVDWGDREEGPPSGCISTGPGTPCLPGGGGSSPNDPGSGSGVGQTESKDSIKDDFVDECPGFGSIKGSVEDDAAMAYERSLSDFILGGLGAGRVTLYKDAQGQVSRDGLDGYHSLYHGRNGRNPNYISLIFESKFRESHPFSFENKYNQAVRHINLLADERDRFFRDHPDQGLVGTPLYIISSQNTHGKDDARGGVRSEWLIGAYDRRTGLHYHDELVKLANRRGVSIVHAKVARVSIGPFSPQATRNLEFQFVNEVQWLDHGSNPFVSWLGRVLTVDPSDIGTTFTYPADLDLDCYAAREMATEPDRAPPGGVPL